MTGVTVRAMLPTLMNRELSRYRTNPCYLSMAACLSCFMVSVASSRHILMLLVYVIIICFACFGEIFLSSLLGLAPIFPFYFTV